MLIGPSVMMLTEEQCSAMNCEANTAYECFFRLFKMEKYFIVPHIKKENPLELTLCFNKINQFCVVK